MSLGEPGDMPEDYAKKESQVTDSLNRCFTIVEGLLVLVDQLTDRMESCCTPSNPQAGNPESEKVEERVPLAKRLDDLRDKISSVEKRMADLVGRIEL